MNRYLIGKVIREARIHQRLNQNVIGKQFCYDRSKISRMEHGMCSDEELYLRVLEYLHVDYETLMEVEQKLHKLLYELSIAIVNNDSISTEIYEEFMNLQRDYPILNCCSLSKLIQVIAKSEDIDESVNISIEDITNDDHTLTDMEEFVLNIYEEKEKNEMR